MANRAETKARSKNDKQQIMPPEMARFLTRLLWVLAGLCLIGLAVALGISLVSFDAGDPTLNLATDAPVQNLLGSVGAIVADSLLQTVGLGSVALIPPLLFWGVKLIRYHLIPRFWLHLVTFLLTPLVLAMPLSVLDPVPDYSVQAGYGGALGYSLLAKATASVADIPYGADYGSGVIVFLTALLGGVLLFHAFAFTPGERQAIWRGVRAMVRGLFFLVMMPWRAARRILTRSEDEDDGPVKPRIATTDRKAPTRKAAPAAKASARTKARKASKKGPAAQTTLDLPSPSGFRLPPLSLLAPPPDPRSLDVLSDEELSENAGHLEGVLEDFGIQGAIQESRPGPVVTLYELEPARGTKSARVIGLADDIARSMSAVSARVAVVPGRNAIGIELPNQKRQTVFLRELLASRAFEQSKARLPVVLGKDIAGQPVVADLAGMPHLLVAGTTGSGKSVGINTMILSLLYRHGPDSLRLIMVDPKMLELSIYDDIPHLLTPVVTEPKKAVVALKWAVREMEERYRKMSKLGVRNLAAFNKRVEEAKTTGEQLSRQVQAGFDRETGEPLIEEQTFDYEALPYLVIVIDEMADLMLVAGKDVEATVQRLAQMARAAGIHLIMATQRPSVDVITGTIKANFPTRISFQVTSKIDSRTILGEQGAEQLLGMGDMLYMAGGGRITRVHGAFVDDKEVEGVVGHLKKQGAPDYKQEVTEETDGDFDGSSGSSILSEASDAGAESLYDQAVNIVLRDRRASTSYIQRRLKIGYNKAASLIEDMEQQGVISAPNHKGQREVLVPEREEDI